MIAAAISSTVSSLWSPAALPSVAATATSAAIITSWVITAPIAVSPRAGRSLTFKPRSTIDACWKNTIQGMITAPMFAETRYRYFGFVDRDRHRVARHLIEGGMGEPGDEQKHQFEAPTNIAMRSTLR